MGVSYWKVTEQTLWVLEPAMVGEAALMEVVRNASTAVCAPQASLWLVIRGKVQVQTRLGPVQLSARQWIYLDRDTRPELTSDTHAVVLGVVLGDCLQSRLLNAISSPLLPGSGTASVQQVRALLSRWRRLRGTVAEDDIEMASQRWGLNQLLHGFSLLQRHQDAMVERCPGRSLIRRRQLFARIQRARQYLECNLDRPVPVGELSGLCSMSIWYFTKTFSAVYGECPQAMSTRLRLQHAGRLLQTSRLSVAEVGAACGFENNCSFSRAFRAAFGLPPSLYRLHNETQPTKRANVAVSQCQAHLDIAV